MTIKRELLLLKSETNHGLTVMSLGQNIPAKLTNAQASSGGFFLSFSFCWHASYSRLSRRVVFEGRKYAQPEVIKDRQIVYPIIHFFAFIKVLDRPAVPKSQGIDQATPKKMMKECSMAKKVFSFKWGGQLSVVSGQLEQIMTFLAWQLLGQACQKMRFEVTISDNEKESE